LFIFIRRCTLSFFALKTKDVCSSFWAGWGFHPHTGGNDTAGNVSLLSFDWVAMSCPTRKPKASRRSCNG